MTRTDTPLQVTFAFARRFSHDARGATAVEYGLLVACLALLILGAVSATGTNIAGVMNKLSNALK